MIALADIKTALAAILATIPNVDAVNTYGYYPALLTAGVTVVMPPFRTESQYGFAMSTSDEPSWQSHRFSIEFWVPDTGDPKALDAAMSALNKDAAATLLASQVFAVGADQMRLGFFDGDSVDYTLTFEVDDFFTRPAQDGPTYLVATMTIPVTDVI